MTLARLGLLCCVGFARVGFAAETARSIEQEVRSHVSEVARRLEPIYKDLHTHPELSLHEEMTSGRLAQELERLGFQVTTRVGGYGVVGVLKNGSGPAILIRTDMDALPVIEQTGAAYASSVTTSDDKGNKVGVMHACGHDMHMTIFLGTAQVMTQMKDRWHGTLILMGQPAEEKV